MKYIALILVLALPLAASAASFIASKKCSAASNSFCKNR